ncbi:hypothetical protein RhiirA4_498232 [Rhizophagus irregularis]|uniref:Protein kinase domain-containing protein n=1 Tax=Rhizophagus irregularis TaxID=588596 RepID=A0A2I1H2Q5_9GLOM|nr:hypothetical protein RhiirA4_498232 [Rhizophagus irregularis]
MHTINVVAFDFGVFAFFLLKLHFKECRNYVPRDFEILPVIGSGEFASVHAAYWKNTRSKFAIKKFDKISTEKEIINEINLMKMVDFHPNIIKFCGIIKVNELTEELKNEDGFSDCDLSNY